MAKLKSKRTKSVESETPVKKDKLGKRLKRFYRNNRIYCILMGISFACIMLVVISLLLYFITQTRSNPYGHRLDDIKNYDTKADVKAVKESITRNEKIKKLDVRVQGKIIYMDFYVAEDSTLEEMQNIATSSLSSFKQENLSYYDIQFGIYREGYKTYYGSKSSTNSTITWSRYNLDTEKIEKEEKTNE